MYFHTIYIRRQYKSNHSQAGKKVPTINAALLAAVLRGSVSISFKVIARSVRKCSDSECLHAGAGTRRNMETKFCCSQFSSCVNTFIRWWSSLKAIIASSGLFSKHFHWYR